MHWTEQKWFLGDSEAINFASQLWEAAQVWDDVIDEGQTERANDVYQWLAFGVQNDPFFQKHHFWLRPAMLQMYLNWRDANVLEQSGPADAEKAWMLRAGIWGVFSMIAWIVGGEAHSRKVGPEIWRSYGESKQDLLREFGHA